MNQTQFDNIIRDFHRQCESIVQQKRPAYTSQDVDVLINFKNAARDAGISPLQAWMILFNKHYSAVSSYVKDVNCPQAESLHGRFADLKNYIDLGFALYLEAFPMPMGKAVNESRDTREPSLNERDLALLTPMVRPLMDWLRTNRNPHEKLIIDSEHAELVSGEIGFAR